jgi:hypothetical protein
MPTHSRFGAFFSRVNIEREVLGIVNHRFGAGPSLDGLTILAIERWEMQMRLRTSNTSALAMIATLLTRISVRCDAQSDKSRIVFAEDHGSSPLPTQELVQELRIACESVA